MASTACATRVVELIQAGKQGGRIRVRQRHRFHLLVG
jgi:hypothetical protein